MYVSRVRCRMASARVSEGNPASTVRSLIHIHIIIYIIHIHIIHIHIHIHIYTSFQHEMSISGPRANKAIHYASLLTLLRAGNQKALQLQAQMHASMHIHVDRLICIYGSTKH